MTELKLVGLVGSLRASSVNAACARAAIANAPEGVSITVHDLNDVPLFNGDDELEGPPASVVALCDAVADADGVIVFSPEYNGSFPAVTKNAIDWLSRPPKKWEGTPITMVVMSPGPRAGASLLAHFSAIMPFQPVRLFGETLGFGKYSARMTDGEVTDSETLKQLSAFLERFAAFCRE